MPGPTSNDLVVTSYVNQNFGGSYQTRSSGGYTYRVYDNAPGFFWFDNNRDGFFEYGRRDDGYGHWSTFEGFHWDDTSPPPPRFDSDKPVEIEPENNIIDDEFFSEACQDVFPQSPIPEQHSLNLYEPHLVNVDEGWFL